MDIVFKEHEQLNQDIRTSKSVPNNSAARSITPAPSAYFPFISTPSCLENLVSYIFPLNQNKLKALEMCRSFKDSNDMAQFFHLLRQTPTAPLENLKNLLKNL